jgi:hypothetical protein
MWEIPPARTENKIAARICDPNGVSRYGLFSKVENRYQALFRCWASQIAFTFAK